LVMVFIVRPLRIGSIFFISFTDQHLLLPRAAVTNDHELFSQVHY
jgi:hypothetical protein